MSQEQHHEEVHQEHPNPAIEAITALAERVRLGLSVLWPRFRFRQKDEDGLVWEENVDFEKGFYKLRLSWLQKNGVIKLICRWPILIPSENFGKLALLIGKINFGVRVGKFEFDERDGELCLRHSFILGDKYLQLTSIDQRNVLYCNMFVLCHELMESHWDELVRLSARHVEDDDEEKSHAAQAGPSFVLDPRQIDEGDDICDGTMGNLARATVARSEGAFVTKHLKPRKNFGPEEKAVFLREASDAAELHHPNICPVRICVDPPQLVSPYYEKGNLQALLDENKTNKLPQERVYSILLDIARAINYLHDCQIVHGRIKPQNILFGAKGEVVLSDTGFSQTRKNILDGQTAPGENGALYAAPELLFGKPLSPGTDVFALGIIFFQFMMPHAELLPPVVPELIAFEEHIPPAVEKLVRECLHRDATKRPAIIDVIAQLRQLAAAAK